MFIYIVSGYSIYFVITNYVRRLIKCVNLTLHGTGGGLLINYLSDPINYDEQRTIFKWYAIVKI